MTKNIPSISLEDDETLGYFPLTGHNYSKNKTKVCSDCGRELQVHIAFSRQKHNRNVINNTCKRCVLNANQRKYYARKKLEEKAKR